MVEKDWGYRGQRCVACGQLLELRETKAADGRAQYGLVCGTHGRFTDWYLSREDALYANVTPRKKRHMEPRPVGSRDWAPPEPVVMEQPDTGKALAEQRIAEIEAREARVYAEAGSSGEVAKEVRPGSGVGTRRRTKAQTKHEADE